MIEAYLSLIFKTQMYFPYLCIQRDFIEINAITLFLMTMETE